MAVIISFIIIHLLYGTIGFIVIHLLCGTIGGRFGQGRSITKIDFVMYTSTSSASSTPLSNIDHMPVLVTTMMAKFAMRASMLTQHQLNVLLVGWIEDNHWYFALSATGNCHQFQWCLHHCDRCNWCIQFFCLTHFMTNSVKENVIMDG